MKSNEQRAIEKYPVEILEISPELGDLNERERSAYIQGLEDKEEWISVGDELPESGKRVLCLTISGYMAVGYYLGNAWVRDADSRNFESLAYTITHYMPLPKKPNS